MILTKALGRLAEVGGLRCCKRDSFLLYQEVIDYVNTHYDVEIPQSTILCHFMIGMNSVSEIDVLIEELIKRKYC